MVGSLFLIFRVSYLHISLAKIIINHLKSPNKTSLVSLIPSKLTSPKPWCFSPTPCAPTGASPRRPRPRRSSTIEIHQPLLVWAPRGAPRSRIFSDYTWGGVGWGSVHVPSTCTRWWCTRHECYGTHGVVWGGCVHVPSTCTRGAWGWGWGWGGGGDVVNVQLKSHTYVMLRSTPTFT